MHHSPILQDLLIVFAVAGVVVYVFQRIRLPAVVGLLVAGLVVGPHGLGLIGQVEEVELLAEVGIVVLLFTVGLELTLSTLLGMWRVMLAVGLPQVAICIGVSTLATYWYLGALGPALFVGMLVAMSSTAVVMKVLLDRGELGTPQGRLAVAVLLLQDLLVIGFMLAIPLLAPQAGGGGGVLPALARGIAVVAGVLIAARKVIPPLLEQVVRTRNRETFLITIFVLVIGTALLTNWAGLSLALGAFLAGLAVSESEYAHQMFAEVEPFRDTLSSLFFVSVGMLLKLSYVIDNLAIVLVTVLAVAALKFMAAALPTLVVGYPARIAVLTGAALFQVGEFSFVLAVRGEEVGLLSDDSYQIFLAAAVITMLMTPLVIAAGPRLATIVGFLPIPERRHRSHQAAEERLIAGLSDHVIIVGFGLGGQNLARVLRRVQIPYLILELNPDSVRRSHARGEPISYGDCTRRDVLKRAGVQRARMLVIVISDPSSTRRAVSLAHHMNPQLNIVVRTRYVAEIDELKRLGADTIIPEDFVSSIEIFGRVLEDYQVPRNQIRELVDRVRNDQYQALRGYDSGTLDVLQVELGEHAEIQHCLIRAGAPAVGQSLEGLRLRAATGATLVGLRRDGKMVPNPPANLILREGDIAVLFGDRAQLDHAFALLDPPAGEAATGGATGA